MHKFLEGYKGIEEPRQIWTSLVVSVPTFCNGPGQWAGILGNMGKGKCCSGKPAERVCQFISRKSSMIGDPLEA